MKSNAESCFSKEGKRNSIIRQNTTSPFDYKVMTISEAQRAVAMASKILEQSDRPHSNKQAAAALMLSLITGLSVEALVAIELADWKNRGCTGLFWGSKQDDWFLIDRPDIPHRDLSEPNKAAASPDVLVCRKTSAVIYPIPSELGAFLPLRTGCGERGKPEEQAKRVLKEISKAMTRPLTLKMVRTFAENYMLVERPCFADYLMLPSKVKEAETGLYYLQTRRSQVLSSFSKLLEDVGLSRPEIKIKDAFVGSALVPRKEEVRNVFLQMHRHLENVDLRSSIGFGKYHNWLATYVGSMMRLASGGRGERQTQVSMSNLNIMDSQWHLYEKGTLRTIPLPAVLVVQLKYYIGYLHQIKKVSQYQDRRLFEELCRILEPDSRQPLIFSNAASQPFVSIYQTDLLDHMSLGLKKNNLRHFVYSHLILYLKEESLRQYIGHTSFYNNSLAPDSGQNSNQLGIIRTVLDKMFRDLEIAAFDPLASLLTQQHKSAQNAI